MTEKDAEIEQLKAALEEVSDHGSAAQRMEYIKAQSAEIAELRKLLSWTEGNNGVLRADCRRYTALLTRAADALDEWYSRDSLIVQDLIAELRKAAE